MRSHPRRRPPQRRHPRRRHPQRRSLIALTVAGLVVLAGCASTPATVETASPDGSPAGVDASPSEPSTTEPSPSEPSTTEPRAPRVVALGDSFTAGFGYYDDGEEWDDLFACADLEETASVRNNPCSSNSTLRTAKGELTFAPDYGFANQVSWAAQVATGLGVTAETAGDLYANLAVSGSTAREWATDALAFDQLGGLNGLEAVASLEPDVVLMTLGGNPTLSKVLLGGGAKCAEFDKPVQAEPLRACFADLVDADGTNPALRTVYTRLLDTTDARIMALTYPQVVPQIGLTLGGWSPEALLVARDALNAAVMDAIAAVRTGHPEGDRLMSADPAFAVGLPPGDFTSETDCSGKATAAVGVDGPSNQSTPTQELYAEDYAASGWCAGPAWMIAADTGVHPNATGYAEFARVALAGLGRG